MNELFRTPHGSHLYGLAHAESDEDWFVVVEKVKRAKGRYANQTIVDGVDTLVTDLPTFLTYADKGVPQYVEAMFSNVSVVDAIADLRRSWRPDFAGCYQTYRRTALNFFDAGDWKRVRHAFRLAFNLRDLVYTGRFDPDVGWMRDQLDWLADEGDLEKLEELLSI